MTPINKFIPPLYKSLQGPLNLKNQALASTDVVFKQVGSRASVGGSQQQESSFILMAGKRQSGAAEKVAPKMSLVFFEEAPQKIKTMEEFLKEGGSLEEAVQVIDQLEKMNVAEIASFAFSNFEVKMRQGYPEEENLLIRVGELKKKLEAYHIAHSEDEEDDGGLLVLLGVEEEDSLSVMGSNPLDGMNEMLAETPFDQTRLEVYVKSGSHLEAVALLKKATPKQVIGICDFLEDWKVTLWGLGKLELLDIADEVEKIVEQSK